MNRVGLVAGLALLIILGTLPLERAHAQIAGSSTIGVTTEEMKALAVGWSAKKSIMHKSVYNDNKQKIGEVNDLIITPDRSVSYAILGVGGFLGMGSHEVAIPMNHLKVEEGKLILPGATKEALKALPQFAYAKNKAG